MPVTHLKDHLKNLEETINKIKSEEAHLAQKREELEKEWVSLQEYLTLPYLQREKTWIQHMIKELLEDEKEIDAEILKATLND